MCQIDQLCWLGRHAVRGWVGVGRVLLAVWENLAGVHAVVRREGIAHQHHSRHIVFGKDQWHLFLLLQAYAVLTCKRTSGIHADLQHFRPGLHDSV